jgi:hypothetical protein
MFMRPSGDRISTCLRVVAAYGSRRRPHRFSRPAREPRLHGPSLGDFSRSENGPRNSPGNATPTIRRKLPSHRNEKSGPRNSLEGLRSFQAQPKPRPTRSGAESDCSRVSLPATVPAISQEHRLEAAVAGPQLLDTLPKAPTKASNCVRVMGSIEP